MQPTDGVITQPYGKKNQASGDPFPHTGDDFGVAVGTDVRTIAPGTVIFAGWNLPNSLADRYMMIRGSGNSGLHMIIQHDGWTEIMAHLSEILVFAGAEVRRGQVVAKSGDTGRTQGAHLHYEVLTEPCANVWPFGRYNPQLQVRHEDNNSVTPAGKTTRKEGFLMALTDTEQANLYRHIMANVPAGMARKIKPGEPAPRAADEYDIAGVRSLLEKLYGDHVKLSEEQHRVTRDYLRDNIIASSKPADIAASVIANMGEGLASEVVKEISTRLNTGS